MVCTCEILAGVSLFGQVKSAIIKISFNKGGVTLQFAPIKFGRGSFWSSQICSHQNFL